MKPTALAYMPSESAAEVRQPLYIGLACSADPARLQGARVLKFGGSSLATPQRIRDVGRIVVDGSTGPPAIVVVSAFQGVTNQLLDCARLAERRDPAYEVLYDQIAARHRSALDALVGDGDRASRDLIDGQLHDLRDALRGIRLLGHCPPAALDVTASFGERLSAIVVAAYLNGFCPSRFVDAREFVTTDDQFTQANVIFSKTNLAVQEYFSSLWRHAGQTVAVVTGFIGRTEDGRTTTIGRNGSDYSAAIIGGALAASAIEIWTDVDGVLSADPKAVPSAFALPQITYEEAIELSYFGAKVLHMRTIGPAVARSIPILIKNSLNPSAPGTVIASGPTSSDRRPKGITSIGDLTLVTLRTRGMNKVRGAAERLFRALELRGVSVILGSHAGAERTLCLAVKNADAPAAVDAIAQEFRFELEHDLIALDQTHDRAVVAVVGNGMHRRPDIAGKVFGALGRHNIAFSAIAQGASEHHISCVVDASQQTRALNVIHRECFETGKPLALVVVGVGKVGSALLRCLHARQASLREQGIDLRVIAIADSRRFVVAANGIDLERWRDQLDASDRRANPWELADEVAGLELANAALVDCTAESSIVDAYPEFIAANLHVITPNKLANVLPWQRYIALRQLLAARGKHFLDGTTVGAGLPVLSTLRNLMASGDVIRKVEGLFSGTLSYLFNTFDGRMPFSALVRDAHRAGYTEPDPREDLSGRDVARKLLIVGRHAGSHMDLDDVRVDSLIPRGAVDGPFSPQLFSAFAGWDEELQARLARARARRRVLRYVGTFEGGRAHAELRDIPRDHLFAATRGSDNVIAITSNRYREAPLVVQGPGAGAEVTALGVFSDVVTLLNHLPH